jgi:hypothetical protein
MTFNHLTLNVTTRGYSLISFLHMVIALLGVAVVFFLIGLKLGFEVGVQEVNKPHQE